jgi:ATP-dependent protease Clp ATPase subunit
VGELLKELRAGRPAEIRPDPRIRRPPAGDRHADRSDDEAALVTILTEPKNALVKQYAKAVRHRRRQADLHPRRAEAIAKRAIKRKTGARGLRSIMEDILLDTMFELPGMDGVNRRWW